MFIHLRQPFLVRLAVLVAVLVAVTSIQAMAPAPALAASTMTTACSGVNLRTRPTTAPRPRFASPPGPGWSWSPRSPAARGGRGCGGRAASGRTWYRVSSINGRSVRSRYGVPHPRRGNEPAQGGVDHDLVDLEESNLDHAGGALRCGEPADRRHHGRDVEGEDRVGHDRRRHGQGQRRSLEDVVHRLHGQCEHLVPDHLRQRPVRLVAVRRELCLRRDEPVQDCDGRPGTHAQPDAEANPDPDTETNAHAHAHAHEADANPDADSDTHADPDTGIHARPDADRDPHAYEYKKTVYLINEAAQKKLEWTEMEGKEIGYYTYEFSAAGEYKEVAQNGPVVGVVKNYHQGNLKNFIEPLLIVMNPEIDGQMAVKMEPGELKRKMAAINDIWDEVFPDKPFEYSFINDDFTATYREEMRTGKIISLFSGFTILISCMGLFGLAAFTTQQRIKEIGIRKVLGASVSSIVRLLSKDFLKLVAFANILAWPIAWFLMGKWLEDFAYRINISWWIFGVAGILTLLIAMFTVGTQATKAAIANPVKSLSPNRI